MKHIVFILLLLLSLPALAGDMYIKSTKCKVLDGPGFGNKVVMVLNKGDVVKVLEEKGPWLKVSVNGKTGWISKLLASKDPPLNKVTVTEGKETEKQKSNVRKRASGSSTAAAARGLREDDRARLSDATEENYQALQQVEKRQVDDKAVDNFSRPLSK